MSIILIERAHACRDRTAIVTKEGTYSYGDLLDASARVAGNLLASSNDLAGERVAFLVPASFAHVAVQWGIWRAGGIAVPLCVEHPPPELQYVVRDCGARHLVVTPALEGRLQAIAASEGSSLLHTDDLLEGPEITPSEVDPGRPAMIVYTSGTTGGPKGALTSHANLRAQIESLVQAWSWTPDDRVLLVLPLHHVHGIVNVLGCALWSRAVCEMLPGFDACEVWECMAAGELTLFMAVPTIYAKLLASWEGASPEQQRLWSAGARGLRLMVSGSAALPVRLLERWRQASGHTLLERYGMTEVGMALANPLEGERRPGHVGTPLPGVEVRRLDASGRPAAPEEAAEIEVRGPGVFREYWGRPEETAKAFREGWFRTGDLAVVEQGSYRILGRQSIDIIKSGGYKISALEVEEVLREHPSVVDCAVVGVADPDWGERVAAAVVLCDGGELSLGELRSWAKQRIAAYKVPTRLKVVAELPRNPLGKVVKPQLAGQFREP